MDTTMTGFRGKSPILARREPPLKIRAPKRAWMHAIRNRLGGMPRRLCYDAALRSACSCGVVLPDEPDGGLLSPPGMLNPGPYPEAPGYLSRPPAVFIDLIFQHQQQTH